jgi:hypothetical protein
MTPLPDLITSAWIINYRLIDANTHVLSPLMNTSDGALKPNIATTKLEANVNIEASNTYLPATDAIIVMDSYETEALMLFNATVYLNGLLANANTPIDATPSFNFVSKELLWLMVSINIVRLTQKQCKRSIDV